MSFRLKLTAVIAMTVVMAALTLAHVHGVNGPWYWTWSWRRLSWLRLYPVMLVGAAPFFLGQYLWWKNPRRWRPALALVTLSALVLQIASATAQPPFGLKRMQLLVENSVNTSYYTSAKILYDQPNISVPEWLQIFPEIAPQLMIHARYKPPGLILFYYALMKVMGPGDATALLGGLLVALAATMAAPVTYFVIARFSNDKTAALCGASFIALTPSLILFVPQFDQVYVPTGGVLLLLWRAALESRGLRAAWWAIAFGALLALGLFMSYIFLVLGVFVALYTLLTIADTRGAVLAKSIALSVIAVGTIAAVYWVMWLATGFDAIATFEALSRVQAIDLLPLIRPFPRHIVFDVLDFALGSGWISFLLVGFYLAKNWRPVLRIFHQSQAHRLVFLALAQIVVTALAALLPGETARLWMLLLPLLMAVIGFELSHWPVRARVTVYACLWLLLTIVCQNMTFLYMGPELDGPRS